MHYKIERLGWNLDGFCVHVILHRFFTNFVMRIKRMNVLSLSVYIFIWTSV